MAILFVDGKQHYTTQAQGMTKYAVGAQPLAGLGAFAQPASRYNGEQYNYSNSATVEFGFFYNGDTTYGQWIGFREGITNQVWIWWMGDGGLRIYRGFNTTLIGTVAGGTIQLNVQNHFRIRTVFNGATGTVDIWLNGVNILSLTGQNTAPSGGNWSTNLLTYSANSSNVAAGYFSHIMIGDTSGDIVGQPRFGALFPNGVGNYTGWTKAGSAPAATNWQSVNETTPDADVTYVGTTVVGTMDSYQMQDLAATASTVNCLAVTMQIEKEDANVRTVAAFLRIGGVDYVHPTTKAVNAAPYAYLQWIWTVSPATSVAFTVAEVNALEAGIKVIA